MRAFRVWVAMIAFGVVAAAACGGKQSPAPKAPTPAPEPEAAAPAEVDASPEAGDDADRASPPAPPPAKVSVRFEDGPHPEGHSLWLNSAAVKDSVELVRLGPGQRCVVTRAPGKDELTFACGLEESKRGTVSLKDGTLTVALQGKELPFAASGQLDASTEVAQNPPREACPEKPPDHAVNVAFDVVGGKLRLRIPSLKIDLDGGPVSKEQFCRTVVLAKRRIRLVCTMGLSGSSRELVLRGNTLYLTDSVSEMNQRSSTEWGGVDVPCGSRLKGKPVRLRGAKYAPSGSACNAACASGWTDCSEPCHVKSSDDDGELTDKGRACIAVCHTKFTACQQACASSGK